MRVFVRATLMVCLYKHSNLRTLINVLKMCAPIDGNRCIYINCEHCGYAYTGAQLKMNDIWMLPLIMFFENEIAVPKHLALSFNLREMFLLAIIAVLVSVCCCIYINVSLLTAHVHLHFEASHMVNIISTNNSNNNSKRLIP